MDEYHYGTIVDMTPAEVGRNPELMKRVAQKTGANVIAVSGFFPERMGIPYWFRRQTVEELAEFYVRDLTEGMVFAGGKTGIKAGAIKIATGPGERRADAEPDRAERSAHPQVRGSADPRGGPRAEGHRLLHQHAHRPDGLHRHQSRHRADRHHRGGRRRSDQGDHRTRLRRAAGPASDRRDSASAALSCRSTISAFRGGMPMPRSSTSRWPT